MHMHEFFVSYSRRDADIARAVGEALARLGLSAWMAEAQILIEGRRQFKDEQVLHDLLREAAANSRRCVVLLSHHAFDRSDWVLPVELPFFLERSPAPDRPVVWPVVIDPDAKAVKQRWDEHIAERGWPRRGIATTTECGNPHEAESTVRRLCDAAGLLIPETEARIALTSTQTVLSRLTVKTQRRQFSVGLDIGTEWISKPPIGQAMLLNLENRDTGMMLNMIVGGLPPQVRRGESAEHVDEANYFAEPFVTRRIAFTAEFGRAMAADTSIGDKRRGFLELVKLKLSTAIAGRQEVLGSHVVNAAGRPHFAYSYRMKPPIGPVLIARKYSVILGPPGSDRDFEFVFTAGFPGSYRDFLMRIPRVDSIVRSFRFEG